MPSGGGRPPCGKLSLHTDTHTFLRARRGHAHPSPRGRVQGHVGKIMPFAWQVGKTGPALPRWQLVDCSNSSYKWRFSKISGILAFGIHDVILEQMWALNLTVCVSRNVLFGSLIVNFKLSVAFEILKGKQVFKMSNPQIVNKEYSTLKKKYWN